VGDHAVVLGEVRGIAQIAGTPLLYGMRRFASWPRPVPVEQQPEMALDLWAELSVGVAGTPAS
jgi:hypothetical protein